MRVHVDDAVRVRRGWVFQSGVDDVASECDLDAFGEWDVLLQNNSNVNDGGGSSGARKSSGVNELLADVLRLIDDIVV